MSRELAKVANSLRRALRLASGRGTIKLVNDAPKMQTVQVQLLDGEVRDGVEVMQYYGLTSVPLADSEAILVAVGGNRDHLIVTGHGDRRNRMGGMNAGEVSLYNANGSSVKLSNDGILINGGGQTINITNAPNLNIVSSVHITGDFSATGGTFTHADTDVGQDHMHQNVQPGTGDSGVPIGGGTGDYGGGVVGTGDGAAALTFWDSL